MKKIPDFKSIEEEAEFWDTHDSTEYLDWSEAVEVEDAPRPLSPRCPVCGEILLSRYVEKDVVGGLVTIHRLRELYCPEGHYTGLAEESRKLVEAVEKAASPFVKLLEKAAA